MCVNKNSLIEVKSSCKKETFIFLFLIFSSFLKTTVSRSEKVTIKVNKIKNFVFSLFCFKNWYMIGFILILAVIFIFNQIYISNFYKFT